MNEIPKLEDQLPANPMTVLQAWLDHAVARKVRNNANSMTLATASLTQNHALPHARVLLCKGFDAERGFIVFYTNYQSAKGKELEESPFATAVFHWDTLEVQARVQGPVEKSPPAESDAYFATRPRDSQLGAWASRQSQAIESRPALLAQLEAVTRQFADTDPIPRPPHWGGYRLWAETVELWVGAGGRLHDRAQWRRELTPERDGGFSASQWRGTRLQP